MKTTDNKKFSEQFQEHLQQLLDELKKLETKIRTASKEWKENNPEKWAEWKRKQEKLKVELRSLDEKGGKLFDEMKQGFQSAVDEIDKAIDELRKKF